MNKLFGVVLVVQACLLLPAQAQDLQLRETYMQDPQQLELNVTTPLEDYVIHNQRQYAINLLRYDAEVDAYRGAYQQSVQTIYKQIDVLSFKLREIEEFINPLELLDDWHKHCVQKYRENFVKAAAYKASITTCAATANNYIATLLANPINTRKLLATYYSSNLPTALDKCKKTHTNPSHNYTLCVTAAIDATDIYTLNNRKTFDTQMLSTNSTGGNNLNQGLECSLNRFYDAVVIIGGAQESIDKCIAGQEFCPNCVNATSSQCENYFDFNLYEDDFHNATMQNPFYGMNTNLDCLTVNFKKVNDSAPA